MMTLHSFKKYIGRSFRFVGKIIQYGCITHCFFEYVGGIAVCDGPSMQPTLNSHDIVITECLSPRWNNINRGDIVIARSPSNPHKNICKRVSAISGDKVRRGIWSEIVPRGHVWLQGDNDQNSTDSRNYGAVPQGLIFNRAIFKIWPLSDFGIISSNDMKS